MTKVTQLKHLQYSFKALKGKRYWTAGNDLDKEGVWKWSGSGQRLRYTNFAPGEPNNLNNINHCLAFQKGFTWDDGTCTNKNYYICEQQLIFTV